MTKKNQHIIFFSTLSFILILTLILTLFYFIKNLNRHNLNYGFSKTNNQKQFKFFIKDINGKVNIFENSNLKEPAQILEKPTIFLPEYDQKLLIQGIYISDINELNNLIEDYED